MALKFKPVLQKGAINKTTEGGIERVEVYYPQLVELNNMDLFQLVDAILNLGSTAFTRGEWTGVISDLGSAVAQQLINGQKVNIPGLGTFMPVLETSQANIKDPSKINSSNFTCSAKFIPDSRFTSVLDNVEWTRVSTAKSSASGSASYVLTFVKQTNSANLKFTSSNPDVLKHMTASSIVCLIDGVAGGTPVISDGVLYINDAIPENAGLTNATVKLTMPAVTWTEGSETYEYASQTFELTGIAQTGPEGAPL